MKPRKIIIFTQRFDLDADAVILRLRAMGQLPVRVNSDDPPEETYFSLQLSGGGHFGRLRTRNREIDLGDIRSAYWRAPARFPPIPGVSSPDRSLVRRGTNHTWRGLLGSQDCYWMNSPDRVRQSGWRPKQLKAAVALGFSVPRTLVTSHSAEAAAFCEECGGRVVFRIMSESLTNLGGELEPSGKPASGIYPSLVTLGELKQHAAEIDNSTCLFQEYVEWSMELRITVVGEKLFAAEIDAKEPLWSSSERHLKNSSITIGKGSLPEDIQAQCLSLAKEFGLNYAVINLLRKPDGQYIFLEINPNGQFLPIEQHVPELKITDALVASLLRGSEGATTML